MPNYRVSREMNEKGKFANAWDTTSSELQKMWVRVRPEHRLKAGVPKEAAFVLEIEGVNDSGSDKGILIDALPGPKEGACKEWRLLSGG